MRRFAALASALALAACATQPPREPPQRIPPQTTPQAPPLTLAPASFADLPGWSEGDHAPALQAFRRSCAATARRDDSSPLGRAALYGGTIAEWRAACAAAETAADPRAFFEAHFTPHEVQAPADAMRLLTGYYEPVIEARRTPDATFSEPFRARPADLVGIDMSVFDDATDLSGQMAQDVSDALRERLDAEERALVAETVDARLARRFRTPIWGRLTEDRRVVPYAKRGELSGDGAVLAYGRPCDKYDLQVQGSGRVRFEDGAEMRMAYAAQNGWRWNSVYRELLRQGAIAAGSKAAVCAWMASQPPEAVRAALDLDPSYVFFQLDPIADPAAGPRGAQGVPLTPLGSIAVDPAAHPYGAVLYVDTGAFRRALVAQDTGGAIRRGPLRGDVFFGTGDAALAQAERMNAPARFWTLLPRPQLVAMN